MNNAPSIITEPGASVQELHKAGVYVYENGERQFVGHMSSNTLRHVTRRIADVAMDKESEIAIKGYSILGTVRGDMAYDMIEAEIERASDGELFRQIVESHPLWYHIVDEHKKRHLTFPYYRV